MSRLTIDTPSRADLVMEQLYKILSAESNQAHRDYVQ